MSHPTTVRFDDGEYRRLQKLADKRGVSVSELVREAVRSSYLEEDRQAAGDALVAFIQAHRDAEGEGADQSPSDIDHAIDEAMRDAAG